MISIVIIVKNDRGIKGTLQALIAHPKTEETEIIVVDSTKNGALDEIRDELKSNQIAWLKYKNTNNKRITIPEQRNTGVSKASGDIIVFIDANCIPQEGWLKNLIQPIREEGEVIVAGATKSQEPETIHDQVVNRNSNTKYVDECPTINLAFKKTLLDDVGFFDETFNYGSDVDFSWRVIDKGYKVRNVPGALITHDWGDLKDELKRSILYGEARARLYRKHKKRWKLLFTKDIVCVIYPVYIIFLPLTIFLPWYPFLIIIPAIRNWNKNPTRTIIDHLIYGLGILKEVTRIK